MKNKSNYKKFKIEKKLYINKIFSYKNTLLDSRNYSRKDFANSLQKLVIFDKCKFEQTLFKNAKFDNCQFNNCDFQRLSFENVIFLNVTFQNCHFSRVLFYKCSFDSILFENNVLEQLSIYPFYPLSGLELSKSISATVSPDLQQLLDKAILHKYIRESNTIFKKVRNTWPQDVKRELKKIKKKDEERLGLTKKQRLKENAKRKAERKKLQQKNYQDSLLGKNRKLDPGILDFLLMQYSEAELMVGLLYIITTVNKSFHELSFLLKYIDDGNKLHSSKSKESLTIN